MRIKALSLALLAALPVTASAQTVSVGGVLDEPVGQLVSVSVGVTGTGVARVSITPSGYNAFRYGNDPLNVSNSPFTTSGVSASTPGSSSFINVSRSFSPVVTDPVNVSGVNRFNAVNAPGSVSVQVGNPFTISGVGSGFAGGVNFAANGFANNSFAPSFIGAGGFFSN